MAERGVSIGRLGLSVPGADRGAGRRVAESVASRLAARMPSGLAGGRLERLEVTVRPRDSSEEAMTEAVVHAVLGALGRRRR